jgi:hypothetical protein
MNVDSKQLIIWGALRMTQLFFDKEIIGRIFPGMGGAIKNSRLRIVISEACDGIGPILSNTLIKFESIEEDTQIGERPADPATPEKIQIDKSCQPETEKTDLWGLRMAEMFVNEIIDRLFPSSQGLLSNPTLENVITEACDAIGPILSDALIKLRAIANEIIEIRNDEYHSRPKSILKREDIITGSTA